MRFTEDTRFKNNYIGKEYQVGMEREETVQKEETSRLPQILLEGSRLRNYTHADTRFILQEFKKRTAWRVEQSPKGRT